MSMRNLCTGVDVPTGVPCLVIFDADHSFVTSAIAALDKEYAYWMVPGQHAVTLVSNGDNSNTHRRGIRSWRLMWYLISLFYNYDVSLTGGSCVRSHGPSFYR